VTDASAAHPLNHAERAQALASVLQCSPASAQALAEAMALRDYHAKTILIHQGDRTDSLWLILGGTVQLQAISADGQVTVLCAFGPGELVGAFEREDESACDARAFGRVEALQIETRALQRLIRDCPDLGGGMSRIYAAQLGAVIERLSARVTLSATGRLYRELLRMAGDANAISPPPVISALALSAQTTRETGSRAISVLERRGIIERDEQRLTIVSRRMLEDLVV
jgi:CRP-like cAMP-binding protein